MKALRSWLLPEAIEDLLPAEAWQVELLRRRIVDEFRCHGYELVAPPLLEYVDSLLTGSGRDLDLRTFKLVDQLSGRTMGLRADITPQVARIDAHLLNRAGVTRLCYCGSVLHALPAGLLATREPLQIGAELYGHAGIEADSEIVRLLARSLSLAGIAASRIDLGHVGVFHALVVARVAVAAKVRQPSVVVQDLGLRHETRVFVGVAFSVEILEGGAKRLAQSYVHAAVGQHAVDKPTGQTTSAPDERRCQRDDSEQPEWRELAASDPSAQESVDAVPQFSEGLHRGILTPASAPLRLEGQLQLSKNLLARPWLIHQLPLRHRSIASTRSAGAQGFVR
jgi:hypothetical protein